jgi:hypothetical protein
MAMVFTQTDTASGCAAAAFCSGLSAMGEEHDSQATIGGSAGSAEDNITIDGNATNLRAYYIECVIPADYLGDAGDWTVRLNLTDAASNSTWTHCHICRVNSGCTNQETIGSNTSVGQSLGTTGTLTATVSGSAVTLAANDRVMIVFGFTNTNSCTRTFGITPSLNIDSPFSAAPITKTSSENLAVGIVEVPEALTLAIVSESFSVGMTDVVNYDNPFVLVTVDESPPIGLVETPVTNDDWTMSLSGEFAPGVSTFQLTAPATKSTTDFVTGRIEETDNPCTAIDITTDDYTEIEYCITPNASAGTLQLEDGTPIDVYEFRIVLADGTVFDTYTVTPEVQITSAVTVKTGSESLPIGLVEVSNDLTVLLSLVESLPIGLVEALNDLSVTISISESLPVGLVEAVNDLTVSLLRAESLPIGLTDSATRLLNAFTASESLPIGLIEALNTLVSSINRAESLPIGLVEVLNALSVTFATTESLPIGLTEALNDLTVSLLRADTLPIGLAEPLEVFLFSFASSESLLVGITESLDTLVASLSRADTLPIGMGEPLETFFNDIVASDITPVGLIEALNTLIVSVSRADSFSVRITELAEVLETAFILASESLPVGMLTARDLLVSLNRGESLRIGTIEETQLMAILLVTESLPITIDDTSQLLVVLDQVSDTFGIGILESAVAIVSLFLTSTDTLPVTITTLQDMVHEMNQSESVRVGIAENIEAVAVTFATAEALGIGLETATVIANTLGAVSEELGIKITVALDLVKLLSASESLPVGIAELFVDMTVSAGASETVPVQILDTLNQLFVTIALSKTFGVSIQEVSGLVRLLTATADQFAVGLIELTDLIIDDLGEGDLITKTGSESLPITIEDVTNTLQVLISISEVLAVSLTEASGLLILLQPVAESLGVGVTTLTSTMAQIQVTESTSILLSPDALIASVLTVSSTIPVQTIEQLQTLEVTLALAEDLQLGWAEAPKLEGVLRTASEILGVGITELGEIGISALSIEGTDVLQIQLINEAGDVIVTKILDKVRDGMGIRRDKEIRPRSYRIRPGRVW